MKHQNDIIKRFKNNILSIAMSAAVLCSAGAFAQGGLTPDHVARMQTVTSSKISNDGNHIAYTVTSPADPYEENQSALLHLYVHDVKSGTGAPYYKAGSVSSVAFRPGKGTVTFLTKGADDKSTSLYEMPLSGGTAVKLFEYEQSISSYDWHPEGDKIAFTSTEKAESSSSPLPYKVNVYEENRPNRKAYIADVKNPDEIIEIKADGSVYLLNWSPGGDKLAISAAPSPEVDDYYMAQRVMAVNPGNGNIIAKWDNEGKLGQIEWSPSGDKIAIRAASTINDPTDGRILIASTDGGKPSIIDADFEGKYEQIKWTGKSEIHFVASKGIASMIGTISPDGSKKTVIFESNKHVIRGFDGPGGKILSLTANTPEHPGEVFTVSNKKNASPKRVTHHNSFLNDIKLGAQETVTYKSDDGKFEIQGILIRPVESQTGDRFPVITVVHGGPEAHYGNGWLTAYSMPGQVAAGKGYAIFYPNYRGSTGRGIEFAHSSQGDLSGKEFDDVVTGIDHLIENKNADKNRIGVTGGSYGGYASAWMSTYYSHRFAASVMFVGISNNLSKWGTSDIPDELYYVHARERMWESDEKWMDYLKRSPIYHVDKARTPILIMHGAEDTRVHPAQSLELYRHLKVRKPEVPVRLVYYPGEGHGNRRSSSQYEYAVRMMQWFDTYLMTGKRNAKMPHWDSPAEKKEK